MDSIQVKATCKYICYEKDNYAILGTEEGFSVKGNILDSAKSFLNEEIIFKGKFEDSKYGKTFNFESYSIADGLYHFLVKIVKGVPKESAKEISKIYKDNIDDIIENNIELLKGYKGVGPKKLVKIKENWQEYKNIRELSEYLLPFGITNKKIIQIYVEFKENSLDIVKNQIYRITEIDGIGFKTADEIALKIGYKTDHPERIKACILYCLNDIISNMGHTVVLKEVLEAEVLKTIPDINTTIYQENFNILLDKKITQYQEKYVTTPYIYMIENYIYNKLKNNNKKGDVLLNNEQLNEFIVKETKLLSAKLKKNVTLGEKQLEAIKLANQNYSIFAIAGYAGSGKSSISKIILDMFKGNIICCALSGIAANRIKNSSSYPAMTIHSLLGYRGAGKWEYNKDNKLPYDIILLDESSMVDVDIFFRLFTAIDFSRTKLILLGDPAQLQPIGAGSVFTDMLNCNLIPYVILDKIYRQDETKVISIFANEVRNGNAPTDYMDNTYSDFLFKDKSIANYWAVKKSCTDVEMKAKREELALETIKEIKLLLTEWKQMLVRYTSNPLEYISKYQIIIPMKDGILATKNLNIVAQHILNPIYDEHNILTVYDRIFKLNDKVVHLKNKDMICRDKNDMHCEKRICNGQIGMVKQIFEDAMEVYYPHEEIYVKYNLTLIKSGIIDLAYALTIHKVQGSEFQEVLVVSSLSHYMMLNAKLLYTAMTRAKDKITFIGEKAAFEISAKKLEEIKRITILNTM